jgi:hypothetical protein
MSKELSFLLIVLNVLGVISSILLIWNGAMSSNYFNVFFGILLVTIFWFLTIYLLSNFVKQEFERRNKLK